MSKPRLSIIIVNWNSVDFLKKCLPTIPSRPDFEIIVVDNASTKDNLDQLIQQFSPVKLIRNRKNYGFGRANNIGLGQSRGEYVLFLNPDTEIIGDSLEKMIAKFESTPRAGLIGPKIIFPDGRLQPSCRQFPTLASQLPILLKLHNIIPNFRPIAQYHMTNFDYQQTQEVNQLMGACLLTSRQLLDQIGGFDQNFWNYFEEVDLCYRFQKAGYKNIYYPDAVIKHHKGQSFAQLVSRQKAFNQSMSYYFTKNISKPQAAVIKLINPLSLSLAWATQTILKGIRVKKDPTL